MTRTLALALVLLHPLVAHAQDSDKRIFGIIPNYRTVPTMKDYQPISASEKFRLAKDDALDRGTFVLAALFGAEGQLTDATPEFGSGLRAYAKYSGASLADWMIGDYMTEAIYPSLLHQDPRYFRRAEGSGWSRFEYSVGQIVLTHGDGGKTQFNVSELLGNATAVGVANAYYPGSHKLSANLSKLAIQLAVDAAANVLKEFAPDLTK
ncbi:MAG TPA: hypothetical protein VFA59_10425 [Vicinamibacterales bacterium]|nr:hypothetical protein [Vicinamibacterales bacterium]